MGRLCLSIVLIVSLSYFAGSVESLMSVFRKSHVASFRGRVACRFSPLEGLRRGNWGYIACAEYRDYMNQVFIRVF